MAILKIGRTIKNRYRVDKFLGRGGMAEVYKVEDTQRGVYLAMKVLFEDLAEDRVFLKRFQREAQNLAKLQHPNIVRFYRLEQEGRLAFIIMDYIDGTTLRGEIFDASKPLPKERIIEILTPVCKALHYAHQMGKVHCDIKPGNIMIDKHGIVYLVDFGIARSMDTSTSTMVGIGTPAYMSPELVKEQDPSPQSDIYSLGIVLYEMLTGGDRPFIGDRATITGSTGKKVRWEQVRLEPEPPSTCNKEISEEMDAVVMRCLEKEPSQRYASSSAFLEHLKHPDSAPPVSAVKQKAETTQKVAGKSGTPAWQRWYLWAGLAAAAVVLFMRQIPPPPLEISTPSPVVISAPPTVIPTSTPENTHTSGADGMEMVLVPAGTFLMGEENDPDAFDDEKPEREVYLDAFWIDKTEVTNGMYEQCVDASVCLSQKKFAHNAATGSNHFNDPQYNSYPAVYVNWEDGYTYCSWVGRRLPTEAEWEKAARGTNGYKYPWGNSSPDSSYANFNEYFGDTQPVGSYPKGASPYGALDMAGNVYEWTADWFSERYDPNDLTNPKGPSSGTVHVLRGASFFPDEQYIRTTLREAAGSPKSERYGSGNWGFRCVISTDDL